MNSEANARYDGHVTIIEFTTNWRVAFGTPESREAIGKMAEAPTFEEAARAALEGPVKAARVLVPAHPPGLRAVGSWPM